jgi:hypothetical protein
MNFWLPELNPNPALGNGSSVSGKLFTIDKSVRELANTIKVPVNIQSEIRSIPDVWARAMLYQDVFTTYFNAGVATPPSYINGLIGQWRGLLAAIVLGAHYGIDIVYDTLDLNTLNGDFIDDIKLLLPTSTPVVPGTSWASPNLIMLKRKNSQGEHTISLGVTSPTTLFYPSASLCELSNLDWYEKDSGLCIERLTTTDKYVLYSWLIWVHEILSTAENSEYLLKVIKSYSDDLVKSMGNALQNGQLNNGTVNFTPSLRTDLSLSLLDSKYTNVGTLSDLYISKNHDIIVVPNWFDNNLVCYIYGIYDLTSYRKNKYFKDYISKEISNSNKSVFNITDVFYDKLVYFRSDERKNEAEEIMCKVDFYISTDVSGDIVVNTQRQGDTRSAVVFPIREEVKEYVRNCNVVVAGDTLVVSVTIDLANGNSIVLSKVYDASMVTQLDYLPVTAIWPNVKLQNWNYYYIYAASTSNMGIHDYTFSPNNAIANKKYVTRLNEFPEYLVLKEDGVPVGFIPLSANTPITQDQPYRANIGIDFGTSSSTVYWSVTNGNRVMIPASPLQFESRLSIICCASNEKKTLVKNFITPYTNPVPFPTLLKVHDSANLNNTNILICSNDFFFKSMDNRNDTDLAGVRGQIKWDDNNQYTSSFIAQLVLQAALFARLRGYNNIQWYFSYPLSLKTPVFFKNACYGACDDIVPQTGVHYAINNINRVLFMTESAASARYFLEVQNANVVPPLLVVDIGGGSTDIYMIDEHENSFQSSLPIGARKMLIELLNNRCEYFYEKLSYLKKNAINQIRGIENDRLRDPITFKKFAEKTDEFTVFAETAFDIIYNDTETFGDRLCDTVVAANPANDLGSSYLRSIIMLYVSSIFYYCGMLLRGRFNSDMDTTISICIAGNGSKIVDWVRQNLNDQITQNQDNGIANVLSNFLCAGASIENHRLNFQWTEKPKEEVSHGLIHDVGTINAVAQVPEVILAGIGGRLNNKNIDSSDNIIGALGNIDNDNNAIHNGAGWTVMDKFDEIDSIVSLYNSIPKKFNLVRIDFGNAIHRQANQVSILKQTIKTRTKNNTIGRTSPFVVAIQELAGEILNQWP